MVQVIPQLSRSAALGEATGTALSQVLQNLASQKAQKMQRQQQGEALKELGLPASLASLEPSVQGAALKERGQAQKLEQLMSLLGGPRGEAVQTEAAIEQMPSGLTDEQIVATSLIDPQLARILQGQKTQQLQERKFGQQSKEQAFKITKDARTRISKESRGAKENMARLGRMSQLIDEGKLIGPLWNETLKKFNLDIPALKNPQSQEFDKLTVDFLRGARDIFGARVTNFEVENFLKAIPSLSQTSEGKNRVIRNLKLMNEGAVARDKAMREIIKENKGVPPLDLEEQVEDRAAPVLDALSSQFLSGDSQDQRPAVEIGVDEVIMIDPSGARRKVKKKDVKAASKEGYKLG